MRWTGLIPAAGRGTRLGYDLPKILYPILGRPMLEHLVELMGVHCGEFVVVASPEGQEPIAAVLGGRGRVAVQAKPVGMADAIGAGLVEVRSESVMIVWGDQVALRPKTVAAAVRRHEAGGNAITVPTVKRAKPYIHFDLPAVLQAREGDVMPAEGESDAGLFLVQTAALRAVLVEPGVAERARGAKTGEFNFLPLIPMMGRYGRVELAPIVSEMESVGINTREEAAIVEEWLRERQEV